jgi:hypothetical protein
MVGDLAFEQDAEHLGADPHAFLVRPPIDSDARPLCLYLYCSFFYGGVGDSRRHCRRHVARCRRQPLRDFSRFFPCALVTPLRSALGAEGSLGIDRLHNVCDEGDGGTPKLADRHRDLRTPY